MDTARYVVSNGYITKTFSSYKEAESFFGKVEWDAIINGIHSQFSYSKVISYEK